jgi:hypothetical protein
VQAAELPFFGTLNHAGAQGVLVYIGKYPRKLPRVINNL